METNQLEKPIGLTNLEGKYKNNSEIDSQKFSSVILAKTFNEKEVQTSFEEIMNEMYPLIDIHSIKVEQIVCDNSKVLITCEETESVRNSENMANLPTTN